MRRPRELFHDLAVFPARTPTLPPATHTNAYAIGRSDLVLVDPATPYGDEQRETIAWLRGLEAGGRRVVAIVLTHHHADHAGSAEFFAERLGAPLWAHRLTAERLPGLRFARRVEDGDAIDLEGTCWRVLHTPGHAPGHVCLHEPSRGLLVVGDMVATEGFIVIDPDDGDMADYLAQLERLGRLEARCALPAHGEPIDDPAAHFARYVAHRRMREDRVVGAVVARPGATAEDVLPSVYADVAPAMWPVALSSLRSHLVKLEREGRVRRGPGGGWYVP